MKILIDADGCPVVDITVNLGRKYNINTIITQLAPILINNNLIPKALLHNYGFVYN